MTPVFERLSWRLAWVTKSEPISNIGPVGLSGCFPRVHKRLIMPNTTVEEFKATLRYIVSSRSVWATCHREREGKRKLSFQFLTL